MSVYEGASNYGRLYMRGEMRVPDTVSVFLTVSLSRYRIFVPLCILSLSLTNSVYFFLYSLSPLLIYINDSIISDYTKSHKSTKLHRIKTKELDILTSIYQY